MAIHIKDKNGKKVCVAGRGVTFIPTVTADGTLSWTNDGNLSNPEPVVIRGPEGIQGPQGLIGPKGEPGKPFQIARTYESVDAMEADAETTTVVTGQFVMIDTGNVEDADNAKLYLKTETGWQYICDLSGAAGITGPRGDAGPGLATGGTTGQIPAKQSNADYDVHWIDPPAPVPYVASATAPTNTSILWIDTSLGNGVMKYYTNGAWKVMSAVWT